MAAAAAVVTVVTAVVAAAADSAAVTTVAAVAAVVAADKHSAEASARSMPVSAEREQERSNVLAEGTQPAPKVPPSVAEGTAPEAPAYRLPSELTARAQALGETWAQEYVRELHAQSRDIVGGWPGTLREARRRVLAAMPRHLEAQHLDELARIANLAARRGWESVSEPDLEP